MMMHPFSLQQRIREILNERLQIDVSQVDQDLFEAGILDSLSFVDMLVALEEEFSTPIALDQVDLNDFRSVNKIAEYLSSQDRLPGKGALGRRSTV
jgi:D-alanine--poly(phosphoribitol) ligase subunit 2